MAKEMNHTPEPWYVVKVKELIDPPGGQIVRARRTLIECYTSDLDRATFLFNEFAGVEDIEAELARLRKIEANMKRIASMPTAWISSHVAESFLKEAVALANAANVGGGA